MTQRFALYTISSWVSKSVSSDAQKQTETNERLYELWIWTLDNWTQQKEYKNLESKIRSLELDKKALEAKFNNPELSQDDINTLSAELQTLLDIIEEKEMRWFELAEKLER